MDARPGFVRNTLLTFSAHFHQCAYPTFVSPATRLDALPDPGFFLGQFLVKLLLGNRLVLKSFFLASHEVGVVAGPACQLASIDFDDARRKALQKGAIMSNEHHGAPVAIDSVFQPMNGCNIEMVGRFVEQQQVGFLHQRFCQRHATSPTA